MMDIEKYVRELAERALAVRVASSPAGAHHHGEQALKAKDAASDSPPAVSPGTAIELWSDSTGRLFLVADELDAQKAKARFGAPRGEIYTAAEVRRVIAVRDSAVVAEIHDWKRRFDGVVSGPSSAGGSK